MRYREHANGMTRFDFAFLFSNITEVGYHDWKHTIGQIDWGPEIYYRPPFIDYKGCIIFANEKRWY